MSEALHASSEDRYAAFLGQLKHLLHEAEATRQLATKHDLKEMEARLVLEIRALKVCDIDLAGLDALLVRTQTMADRLSALAAP